MTWGLGRVRSDADAMRGREMRGPRIDNAARDSVPDTPGTAFRA